MARKIAQAGDGKIGCILWGLLLVVAGLIAWKAIPVKIASSELYDFMVEQAKWGATTPTEAIGKAIYEKGRELNLPLDPKNVKVERAGDKLRMRATYTVPLDFFGKTYHWDFDLQVERTIFQF
jgi:hypothetical protein